MTAAKPRVTSIVQVRDTFGPLRTSAGRVAVPHTVGMHTRAGLFIALLALLLALGAGGAAAQEERPEAEGYGIRRPGRAVMRPAGMPVGATGIHGKPVPQGRVDVLCAKESQSLHDCLQRARDAGQGTLQLPQNVALEHVVGLFERGLPYYELHEDFPRYHGYRFVMSFRGLTDGEMEQRDNRRAGALGAGVAGGAALSVVAPFVPLTPIIFLFDSASAEADLERVRADAEERGVPPPNRGSLAATYQDYSSTYEGYLGGSLTPAHEQGIYGAYVVMECAIVRPREREAQTPELRHPARPQPAMEPRRPQPEPPRIQAQPAAAEPILAEPPATPPPADLAQEERAAILDEALRAAAAEIEARERAQAAAQAATQAPTQSQEPAAN